MYNIAIWRSFTYALREVKKIAIWPGVLIWRYGAACSSIIFFAAPAARNAAPEGRSLVINYAWVRPQARATHVEVILATLKSLFLATTYTRKSKQVAIII